MNAWIVQLVCYANGEACPRGGEYVVDYEPPVMNAAGEYVPNTGRIETSRDLSRARLFATAADAAACWRRSNGVRPDGKPNRPLTSYTVLIEQVSITRSN